MDDVLARLNAWDLDEWHQTAADDVRAAIAEIERLRAENARLEKILDKNDPVLVQERLLRDAGIPV